MIGFFNIHTHSVSPSSEREIVSKNVSSEALEAGIVYASVGIHPWGLTEENVASSWEALQKAVQHLQVVAIGEAGLDKLQGPSMELQTAVFRKEIALSEEYCLPLVIHCVRAFNELLQLKKELNPQQPWIIHGFRGKETVAKELLKHDFYLSIGANFQESAVRSIPLNRLFVETDESSRSIELIYQDLAEVKEIPLEELKEAVQKNVDEVFFKR